MRLPLPWRRVILSSFRSSSRSGTRQVRWESGSRAWNSPPLRGSKRRRTESSEMSMLRLTHLRMLYLVLFLMSRRRRSRKRLMLASIKSVMKHSPISLRRPRFLSSWAFPRFLSRELELQDRELSKSLFHSNLERSWTKAQRSRRRRTPLPWSTLRLRRRTPSITGLRDCRIGRQSRSHKEPLVTLERQISWPPRLFQSPSYLCFKVNSKLKIWKSL